MSYVQGSLENGGRCSAEKAYLRPIKNRNNLDILINAHVVKIIINSETKIAKGVRYFRNGKYHNVYASKEVVLSAGSQNSPQLLMLSGIGPEEHLRDLGKPMRNNRFVEYVTNLNILFQVYQLLKIYLLARKCTIILFLLVFSII